MSFPEKFLLENGIRNVTFAFLSLLPAVSFSCVENFSQIEFQREIDQPQSISKNHVWCLKKCLCFVEEIV